MTAVWADSEFIKAFRKTAVAGFPAIQPIGDRDLPDLWKLARRTEWDYVMKHNPSPSPYVVLLCRYDKITGARKRSMRAAGLIFDAYPNTILTWEKRAFVLMQRAIIMAEANSIDWR